MPFTDSECVLLCIKATKQLTVFIQNWIDEIWKEEDLVFGFISSVQNPADFATRGLSALEISKCKLGWHKPDWLQYHELNWPTSNLLDITSEKLEKDLTWNFKLYMKPLALLKKQLENQRDSDHHHRGLMKLSAPHCGNCFTLLRSVWSLLNIKSGTNAHKHCSNEYFWNVQCWKGCSMIWGNSHFIIPRFIILLCCEFM